LVCGVYATTYLKNIAPSRTLVGDRIAADPAKYRSKLSMSHSLICWRCGTSLAALSLPLRRLDVCKACNAELHVCKLCVEYDTSYAKHCKEPTAEEVRKKDEANFCDHFKPKVGAYVAKDGAELARAKSALEDLFKK
jgi:hypothetical protein